MPALHFAFSRRKIHTRFGTISNGGEFIVAIAITNIDKSKTALAATEKCLPRARSYCTPAFPKTTLALTMLFCASI
jgi:hypothetical protein